MFYVVSEERCLATDMALRSEELTLNPHEYRLLSEMYSILNDLPNRTVSYELIVLESDA